MMFVCVRERLLFDMFYHVFLVCVKKVCSYWSGLGFPVSVE